MLLFYSVVALMIQRIFQTQPRRCCGVFSWQERQEVTDGPPSRGIAFAGKSFAEGDPYSTLNKACLLVAGSHHIEIVLCFKPLSKFWRHQDH